MQNSKLDHYSLHILPFFPYNFMPTSGDKIVLPPARFNCRQHIQSEINIETIIISILHKLTQNQKSSFVLYSRRRHPPHVHHPPPGSSNAKEAMLIASATSPSVVPHLCSSLAVCHRHPPPSAAHTSANLSLSASAPPLFIAPSTSRPRRSRLPSSRSRARVAAHTSVYSLLLWLASYLSEPADRPR
jgi:hypothetical protein